MLVDVRENDTIRGFHMMAAIYLAADQLRGVELFRIGGVEATEAIACEALRFDTSLELRPWQPRRRNATPFDLYAVAATDRPTDGLSNSARRQAHVALLALMFGKPDSGDGWKAFDGNDTAAIAERVLAALAADP